MTSEPTMLPVEEASYGGQRVRLRYDARHAWYIVPPAGTNDDREVGPFWDRDTAALVAADYFSWGPTFP